MGFPPPPMFPGRKNGATPELSHIYSRVEQLTSPTHAITPSVPPEERHIYWSRQSKYLPLHGKDLRASEHVRGALAARGSQLVVSCVCYPGLKRSSGFRAAMNRAQIELLKYWRAGS